MLLDKGYQPEFDRLFAERYFNQLDAGVGLSLADHTVHLFFTSDPVVLHLSLVLRHTTVTTAQNWDNRRKI